MRTATARAFPNIALVKYWGKRDEALNLPVAGSLSLTLDALPTTTTVEPVPGADRDAFELNGRVVEGEAFQRVSRFLDLVRARAGSEVRAVVRSRNEAPTGAGLASSASGFAALALAASAAYGTSTEPRVLSALARRGSGSAARSIVSGVSVWHEGDGDETSFAEPVDAPAMAMVVVTVDERTKAISSRDAMRATAATSPFYDAWIASTRRSLEEMLAACRDGDFTRIGEITESHALRMHAVIASTTPPIRYLAPASIAAFDAAARLREQGVQAWATADAGPNVCLLVQPGDAVRVADAVSGLGRILVVGAGEGARLVADPVPTAGPT